MKVEKIYKEDKFYCITVDNFTAKATSLAECKKTILEELSQTIDEEIFIMLEEYMDK